MAGRRTAAARRALVFIGMKKKTTNKVFYLLKLK
jgi:hypothetical protein